MPFSARDLIRASQANLMLGTPHVCFEGVSIDTRTLQKGDVFFAIAGPHHDGHDHLAEAVRKGAVGCVIRDVDARLQFETDRVPAVLNVPDTAIALQQWGRFLRERSRAPVIGITGSNGKTTTKEMLASILSGVGKTLSTHGNLNNHLGLPLTLSRLQPEHRFIVLEMGASRPGDIRFLAELARPHIGLITNIGKAHLEGLGSAQGILQEKRALFDALPVDGLAVINQDDPLLGGIANSLRCRKLFFGLTPLADVRADAIQADDQGAQFTLYVRGQKVLVRLAVPGQFQVMNALAAAAAAHGAGASLDAIAQGLGRFRPVAMRMQLISHASGALLINDAYNANPSSVRASIANLCQGYPQRSRWLVLGDMRELGPAARSEHRDLGVWMATQSLQRVYLYGRDTRFVLEGLKSKNPSFAVQRFRKKRLLVAELQKSLTEKPVILFKGSRSMRMEQLVGELSSPAAVSGGSISGFPLSRE